MIGGGIDANQHKDTETLKNIYYYGFTILDAGIQIYFDKKEMFNFLRLFTDKDNQNILRKELVKLEKELTGGNNPTNKENNL